ncbi:hypothetical protein IV65_GL000821 [Lactococcus lactis]|nr:hypothetical protein IV65_GL000821 [Lactococcus lactis subsp. lactis]
MIKWTVGWKLAVFCSFELFKRWRNMTRLTREELEKILYALYQALAKKQEIHEWLLKNG